MREPPGQEPPDEGVSLEHIRQAFQSLNENQWLKLFAYADARVRRLGASAPGRDGCHLFMQAVDSMLESGRRHWDPSKVDLVKFLIDAMWSISSNWARRTQTTGYLEICEADLIQYNEDDDEFESALQRAKSTEANPEEQLIRSDFQTQEQLAAEIENLFKDRYLASLIVEGWKAGMKGPEIIEALNITENQYRSETRLVRRRINARWPKGNLYVR
jgi:hypothetical protein